MRILMLLVLALPFSGCAGSVSWDSCEPEICSAACDFDDLSCVPPTVDVSLGQTGNLVATLDVQGSYAGEWSFSVETAAGLDASIDPRTADVEPDVLFDVDVSWSINNDADPGPALLQIIAERGEDSALTSVSFRVPDLGQ